MFRAALALADADGVEALSMRKLGRALGVEAMSLYHHVPNRAAILDGIAEAVFAEVRFPAPGGPWRETMAAGFTAMRAALLRHPGALPVLATRETTGPAGLALFEAGLAVLTGAGFDVVDAGYLLNNLATYTIGHCLAIAGRQPLRQPEPSPAQRAATVEATATDHPLTAEYSRRATAAGFDADLLYRRGLTALLAGAEPPAG